MLKNDNRAVVLLSGGQDSATCLAMAVYNDKDIHTVSFDYGQRHRIELQCAKKLSELAGAKHHVIPINSFTHLGGSALVGAGDISAKHPRNPDLPASFVPGRNYIFLGLAAALAYQLDIRELWTGVCETDYSGYPDCRATTMDAVQQALRLAMDYPFLIVPPLMNIDKAETIRRMILTGKLDWLKWTHTCYNGQRPPCGVCPACIVRARGFAMAGVADPLLSEGLPDLEVEE